MKRRFDVRISVDERTGAVLSVYLETQRGRSAQTKEYCDGAAFADYDRSGHLLGIELLAPCKLSVLNKIEGTEADIRDFVKRAAPREMVVA
jgi:hypothetical protein